MNNLIPGCFTIDLPVFEDERGTFIKTFRKSMMPGPDFVETFFSSSHQNVLRGMHYSDCEKLVYCVSGFIYDVVLDLDTGDWTSTILSPSKALYVGKRAAHGFYALTDAVVAYQATAEYDPATDKGVRWDSFGAIWPCGDPVISAKDRALVPFGTRQVH